MAKTKKIMIGYLCFIILSSAISISAYASDSVIKLKYGSYAPSGIIDAPILWYFDEVSKRSGSTIKIETYFGSTLAKPQDCLGAIGYRVYDVGWVTPVFTADKIPLATMATSTPIVAQSLKACIFGADNLVRSFQPAAEEYVKADVKFLFHTGVWQYQLISNKPVKSLDDIKGLRVRTFGYLSKAWAGLGGNPVSIPIPDIYPSLQKGILDAVLTQPVSMHHSLRLTEIAKNYTKVNFGCLPTPVLMNLATYNALPENVRKVMEDLALEMPDQVDRIITQAEQEALKAMRENGIGMFELSEADQSRIKEQSKNITKIVVDDLTAKNVIHAQKAMDIYLDSINKIAP